MRKCLLIIPVLFILTGCMGLNIPKYTIETHTIESIGMTTSEKAFLVGRLLTVKIETTENLDLVHEFEFIKSESGDNTVHYLTRSDTRGKLAIIEVNVETIKRLSAESIELMGISLSTSDKSMKDIVDDFTSKTSESNITLVDKRDSR